MQSTVALCHITAASVLVSGHGAWNKDMILLCSIWYCAVEYTKSTSTCTGCMATTMYDMWAIKWLDQECTFAPLKILNLKDLLYTHACMYIHI